MLKLIFNLAILLLLVSNPAGAHNSPLRASVNKLQVEAGEVFKYTLNFEGVLRQPELTLPEFSGFNIASQSHRQREYIKEGQKEASIEISISLFAVKPGVFTIEPAVLINDNDEFTTGSFEITVTGSLPEKKEEKRIPGPYIGEGIQI